MHYIRFLKLPKLSPPKSPHKSAPCTLSAKITIANDLGELFLTAALPLRCVLVVRNGGGVQQIVFETAWTPYARALAIEFPVPVRLLRVGGKAVGCELQISPVSRAGVGQGVVVPVFSEEFGLDGLGSGNATMKRVVGEGGDVLVIREEKGESIARHIWDAGLVLSNHLTAMMGDAGNEVAKQLPRCCEALKRVDVKAIELGTGVGLVGLKLADVLQSRNIAGGESRILLTDLEDAREIVEMNMSARHAGSNVDVEFIELDWTVPLPKDIDQEDWDVVLIADCTYNPDYAQALVNTIKTLVAGNDWQSNRENDTIVLLAMKPRHSAENVFFDYMKEAGLCILEEAKIVVPVLGDEDQNIRIFGFGLDESGLENEIETRVSKRRRTKE